MLSDATLHFLSAINLRSRQPAPSQRKQVEELPPLASVCFCSLTNVSVLTVDLLYSHRGFPFSQEI